MALEAVFDTEGFIQEVNERSCLWNLSSDEYANIILNQKIWEKITVLFYGDECTTSNEKNDYLCK